MRGPEAAEAGTESLRKKEVSDLRAFGGLQVGAEGVAADFFERAGNTARVAGELDGRGVGEKFALTRHGGLDEAAEEIARVADHHQGQARAEDGNDDTAAVFVVAGTDAGIAQAG